MKVGIAAGVFWFALTVSALADGKMFAREQVNPTIPYQRALIVFKDGTETLVLQSKYKLPEAKNVSTPAPAALGWVVPVPAVPRVGSMEPFKARHFFTGLDRWTAPEVTDVSSLVFMFVVLPVLACATIVPLLLVVLSYVLPRTSRLRRNRGETIRATVYILLAWATLFVVGPFFLHARDGSKSLVEVISEQRVGVYDVQVVKAPTADGMITWLNANEFRFGKEDRAVFDAYLAKGWCFVVAKIDPKSEKSGMESEGLAAPLMLRFPCAAPVYPTALTATAKQDTEMLIYLLAKDKMTCSGRLPLRFAERMVDGGERLSGMFPFDELAASCEPAGFLTPADLDCNWLCKFKGTLSPAQMAEDFVFAVSPDAAPYREHVTRW